ncbi:MAG: flippase-like domain-containing protein [Actinobacteria bacterium]|nr:flippase-like domain-containing protein [Actinomycetota bacterium]
MGTGLTVLCGAFVVRVLAHDWARVSNLVVHASWSWLAVAFVGAAVAMVIVAWTWADALAVVGGTMPRARSVAWYFVGEIAKYIPGSIWAAVGRGEIARRRGVPASKAYPSVFLSLVALYLAAVLTAAVLAPFDLAHTRDAGPALLLLLLVPIGLGALHPRVLAAVVELAERITRRTIPIVVPRWRTSVLLVIRYVPAWVAIAFATWAVGRALPGVDAPVVRVALATVLSWTAGFVTPTPGGAGVREAVFVAVSGIAAGPAAAIAVSARIVFVIVDVAGALLGAPLMGRRPAPGAPVLSEGSGPEPMLTVEEE